MHKGSAPSHRFGRGAMTDIGRINNPPEKRLVATSATMVNGWRAYVVLTQERDRYKAALELLAEDDDPAAEIAREALKPRDV